MSLVEDEKRIIDTLTAHCRSKLAEHEDRDWTSADSIWLIDRAREELAELREAIATGSSTLSVWREAADVANFCAMAADVFEAGR